jgi:predicted phosphohydrolase
MSVYGISDLHLSFGTNKPMNIFGKVWNDYEERIKLNWQKSVKPEDFVIIAGDISWATYLSEAKKDFEYINDLPGIKIILKGNHDYYFDTKSKQEKFFKDNNINNIFLLQNNAIDTDEYIICGARGWGDTDSTEKNDDKLIKREAIRLKLSLEEGLKIKKEYEKQGIKKDILVAMHFPPFNLEFQQILEEYKVKKCIYGHLHGYGHSKVKEGIINGVDYVMVSCDYTNFKVVKL